MSRPSPDTALERFTEDLKQRGVATKQLTLTRHFLRHLLTTMRDMPQDGASYRTASATTLRNFPEDPHFVALIRDFYPYWSGEAVSKPTSTPPPSLATGAHLDDILARMESDPWFQQTIAELERHLHHLKCLQRYAEDLARIGLEQANIDARVRLIKLLLFTIRDVPQNTDTYRAGVDKVLTFFPHQERWHTFVSLAREFFYFLAKDAGAAERIQQQISTHELRQLTAS